ncbi:hypothetical protein HELRODRAFT_160076 [Helobdella robusta]|uniref:Uncharacterized protein n=1 Tax=Helobdella robusta TaxID=6412 RepID=T1EPR0_HELRO|nr:hypothetical protein HELRODRAFT_160076 [Helobdella robusta]ESO05974.1 hypothetical protein HELRODRAFT_160076 [Helobdella robusta]
MLLLQLLLLLALLVALALVMLHCSRRSAWNICGVRLSSLEMQSQQAKFSSQLTLAIKSFFVFTLSLLRCSDDCAADSRSSIHTECTSNDCQDNNNDNDDKGNKSHKVINSHNNQNINHHYHCYYESSQPLRQ